MSRTQEVLFLVDGKLPGWWYVGAAVCERHFEMEDPVLNAPAAR